MTPTPIKINPEKMTRKVRLLFETSLVKNLSPQKLAPILHVSAQQIYRWYSGDEPKEGSLALIDQGLEKIRELPDFLVEGKATWGRSWVHDTPERRRQEKKDNEFYGKVEAMYAELNRQAPPGALNTPAFTNPEAGDIFTEILRAFLDYTDVIRIRIPKK